MITLTLIHIFDAPLFFTSRLLLSFSHRWTQFDPPAKDGDPPQLKFAETIETKSSTHILRDWSVPHEPQIRPSTADPVPATIHTPRHTFTPIHTNTHIHSRIMRPRACLPILRQPTSIFGFMWTPLPVSNHPLPPKHTHMPPFHTLSTVCFISETVLASV
jgi:hypothetical protein